MTVYVVQEVAGKNILSAEKYGDLELLLPEGSQLVLSTAPTVRRLKIQLDSGIDSFEKFGDKIQGSIEESLKSTTINYQ